jgi:hypothetical protein
MEKKVDGQNVEWDNKLTEKMVNCKKMLQGQNIE